MGERRFLFVLTGEVRRDFFPAFHEEMIAGARCEWLDADRLLEEEWAGVLIEKSPEVVVTGWGTPCLPRPGGHLPRYVCHLAGSVRSTVPREWLEKGVLVGNWGRSISFCIAEHAVLLVLGALRSMPLWRPFMEENRGNARNLLATRSLRGKRVGIHGLGAVVRELLPMLRGFGVRISVYSEGVPDEVYREAGVEKAAGLRELAELSEIFIELEALTEKSRGSVSAEILERLPEGAVFVNVGRGGVVEEKALAEIAQRRSLRLGLDVFSQEPLPMDSSLRVLPSALLSPHVAGPTADSLALCGDYALRNLKNYLAGQNIEGEVTLEIFDRST